MAKRQQSATDIFRDILKSNWFEQPDYSSVAAPTPRSTELAQYLMSHNKTGPTLKPASLSTRQGAETEEPGVISKIFDAASGPLYAVTNTVSDLIEGGGSTSFENVGENVVGGALRTATGISSLFGVDPNEKTNALMDRLAPRKLGSDILGDAGVENKFAKYGGGFALDVAFDPLTYVPVAGISNIMRKGKKASDALTSQAAKSTPETFTWPEPIKAPIHTIKPSVANMTMKGGSVPGRGNIPLPGPVAPSFDSDAGLETVLKIARDPDSMKDMAKAKKSDDGWRAAQVRWGRDPNKEQAALDNAVSKAEWADQKRAEKLAKAGKVTDGKGNWSNVAITHAIESIQRGELPSFGPKPSAATGVARDIAIREADDHITNVLGKSRTDHNPANQANLYNRLFASTEELFRTDPTLVSKFGNKKGLVKTSSPRVLAARGLMARSMLRSAEDHLIRLNQHPVYWDGTRVRLSEVLEEVGPAASGELPTTVMNAWKSKSMDRIKEPVVAAAITNALARRPLHMSGMLEDLTQNAERAKANILANYSMPKAREVMDQLPDVVDDIARNAGATDAEIKAIKDLVRNVINVDNMPHEKFISILAARMHDAKDAGRLDIDTWIKMNKEITKILGQTKKDLMTNVTGHKVLDGLTLRFSTYHGRIPALKRFSLGAITFGEMSALTRLRTMRNMVKGSHPDEVSKAFMIASGRLPKSEAFSPKEIELASQFEDYFQTMLDSSGLTKTRDYAGTVAERSQMVMEDINRYLKGGGSYFQFQAGKNVKDHNGVVHNFSPDGDGWLKSWILADPRATKQDPLSFMYDMDLAIERTLKEYATIDEFGRTFGFTKDMPGFDPKIHTARLSSQRLPEGVYFQKEHRDMMERMLNDIRDGMWSPNSPIMRNLSRGTRAWKTGVTIYMPSHHIRNLIGDMHMTWWAGHNDPRDFIRARRIMHSQRTKYQDALKQDNFDKIRGLVDQDAMDWAKTQGKDVILKRNGLNVTADELYVGAFQRGLLLDANKYEDLFGQAPLENIGPAGSVVNRRIARPLGGHAHKVASTVAEYREHYVRIHHFTAAVNKNLKKTNDLKKAMDDAAYEVAKWHPDGRDLTRFEQKTRLAIPFYSWTRKAIPLIVEAMVQKPAKVLYYPKAQLSLQGMLGIEGGTMLDPFPDDQLFPDWIRAKGIGPIGDPQSENEVSAFFGRAGRNINGFKGEEGYTIVNPSNPFQDVTEQIFGLGGSPMEIARSIFDSSSPAIKIPGEITSDTTFSGAPISADKPGGKGLTNYLLNQVPILSGANNVAEIDFTTMRPNERPENAEKGMDTQALLNYLTALGLRGTGPYQKTAEFEASDRARLLKENK